MRDRSAHRKTSEMHYHKCFSCGKIWHHPSSCHGDEEAHICPECGFEEWYTYVPSRSEKQQSILYTGKEE